MAKQFFTPTRISWCSMRDRCRNPNSSRWDWYGARGIKICARWDSYENFVADMGERPQGTTLDRVDNNGDYTPKNCRWATHPQQCRNRRSTKLSAEVADEIRRRYIKGNGAELGREYGVTTGMVRKIVKGRAWA